MNKNLNDCLADRNNNLDIIRFLAALAVIYSHSFDIVRLQYAEPLYALTHHLLSIGHLSVAVFFIISGLLITQSYERSKTLEKYFMARCLRIYPGLIVVVLCTVFIIGPIWTKFSLFTYFTHLDTIRYLVNVASIKIYFRLPGILDDAPFPNFAINGSLWTLPYELLCYFMVPAIGLLISKRFKQALLLLPVIGVFIVFMQAGPFFVNTFCFLCGALLYLYRQKIILNPIAFVVALTGLIVNLVYNTEFVSFNLIMGLTLSYVIMFAGFYKSGYFKNFTKNGDYSYGLYIWAFPVQQIVFYNFSQLSELSNFIISAPITLLLAFASWHLIEKNALKLKHYSVSALRFNRILFANKGAN